MEKKSNDTSGSQFILLCIFSVLFTLIGCTSISEVKFTDAADCLDVSQEIDDSVLFSMVDQLICVEGPVRVVLDQPYYELKTDNEPSLYGGKIYIALSYANAIRAGLNDYDFYKSEGLLQAKRSTQCNSISCTTFTLKYESP